MKQPPLPRQLNNDDPREVAEVVRQIVNYLEKMPKFELKETNSSTADHHIVKTDLKNPVGLLRIQAYKTDNVDESLTLRALCDWRRTSEGLKDRIDTSEVNHTFYLLVIGE